MNTEAIANSPERLGQRRASSASHELFEYAEYLLAPGSVSELKLTQPVNLIMVETGHLQLNYYDTTYQLEPGSVAIVDAANVSLASLESQNDALVIGAALSLDVLERFRSRFAQALIEYQKVSVVKEVEKPAFLLFNHCDLTRMAITAFRLVQRKADNALHALKLEELLLLQLSQPGGFRLADKILRGCDPATARFRAFIEANYLNDWSLATFAKNAAMSLTTFKVQFNEIYKTSPRAWINEKRLRYADELLRTSSKRIIEIAFESGFSSQSYFTQAYKSRFGCTPSEVR